MCSDNPHCDTRERHMKTCVCAFIILFLWACGTTHQIRSIDAPELDRIQRNSQKNSVALFVKSGSVLFANQVTVELDSTRFLESKSGKSRAIATNTIHSIETSNKSQGFYTGLVLAGVTTLVSFQYVPIHFNVHFSWGQFGVCLFDASLIALGPQLGKKFSKNNVYMFHLEQ